MKSKISSITSNTTTAAFAENDSASDFIPGTNWTYADAVAMGEERCNCGGSCSPERPATGGCSGPCGGSCSPERPATGGCSGPCGGSCD